MAETDDDNLLLENAQSVSLLPETTPITPEQELADAFGDEFDFPSLSDDELVDDEPIPFGRSWSWDFAKGRFVRYGTSPGETHGVETLKVWVQKTMLTARGAHSVYDDDYGVDDPVEGIGYPQDQTVRMAAYETSVRRALLTHDRITSVGEFDYVVPDDTEVDPNFIDIIFTIVLDNEDELLIDGVAIS